MGARGADIDIRKGASHIHTSVSRGRGCAYVSRSTHAYRGIVCENVQGEECPGYWIPTCKVVTAVCADSDEIFASRFPRNARIRFSSTKCSIACKAQNGVLDRAVPWVLRRVQPISNRLEAKLLSEVELSRNLSRSLSRVLRNLVYFLTRKSAVSAFGGGFVDSFVDKWRGKIFVTFDGKLE